MLGLLTQKNSCSENRQGHPRDLLDVRSESEWEIGSLPRRRWEEAVGKVELREWALRGAGILVELGLVHF